MKVWVVFDYLNTDDPYVYKVCRSKESARRELERIIDSYPTHIHDEFSIEENDYSVTLYRWDVEEVAAAVPAEFEDEEEVES